MKKILCLIVLVVSVFASSLCKPKKAPAEPIIQELQTLISEATKLESEINELGDLVSKLESPQVPKVPANTGQTTEQKLLALFDNEDEEEEESSDSEPPSKQKSSAAQPNHINRGRLYPEWSSEPRPRTNTKRYEQMAYDIAQETKAAAKGKLEFPPDFEDEIYKEHGSVDIDNIPSDSDSDSETDDDSEFTKPEEPKPEKK